MDGAESNSIMQGSPQVPADSAFQTRTHYTQNQIWEANSEATKTIMDNCNGQLIAV